jgi:ribosomal protein S18 acetylase RimI-like enzyme
MPHALLHGEEATVLRDAIPGQDDAILRQLLTFSVGYPTPDKIERRFADYRDGADRCLLAYEVDGRILGSVGLVHIAHGEVVIGNIAVLPEYRGRGIGRRMVQQVWAHFGLHQLNAETDGNAVGFYRRCGFAITSLGEKWPGTERFDCELTAMGAAAPGDRR